MEFTPKWIAWETTRRCNLHCIHCRSSSEQEVNDHPDFSIEEAFRIIDDIVSYVKPVIVLSGGEPLEVSRAGAPASNQLRTSCRIPMNRGPQYSTRRKKRVTPRARETQPETRKEVRCAAPSRPANQAARDSD